MRNDLTKKMRPAIWPETYQNTVFLDGSMMVKKRHQLADGMRMLGALVRPRAAERNFNRAFS